MNNSTETIDISAHHIGGMKAVHLLSKEMIINELIKFDYIKTPEDPFVNLIYQSAQLFENPNQKFKIKIGKLDFICKECPKYKTKKCDPLNPKEILGPAFLITSEKRLTDMKAVKKYGLKEDQEYTAKELRKIAKF